MAFCPRCAAPNVDTAVTCAACGSPITAAAPGAQPPPLTGAPVPNMMPRMNGLAIAGFVCSFLCALVGLILSIVAYNQCKKSNGMLKGEGFAMAGIIISICMIVLNIIIRVAMMH
jgi:hypothetical protein